ncbi:MAG: heat-inducible transcriptional repressor HrcA [Eubacteriales bacterium]|nr:heat-inducible transcriptional repressor HrcA [Eubacteriales bacterium]
MMFDSNLSERKKQILKAIIDAHIAFGEPVGSKYLAEKENISCSPATIRNEMAELEALGYLEQPHTSAGRIPSELGYRFYVDSLVRRYTMTTREIEEIDRSLHKKLSQIDQILAEASKLASSFTNYTGIAVKPKTERVTVSRFEGIFIDEYNFILVMIFPDGNAKTKTVRHQEVVSSAELAVLIASLNEKLTGKSANEVSVSAIMDIEKRLPTCSSIVSPVIKTVYETLSEIGGGDVRIEGVNNLLSYPEYADVSSVKGLIDMFEHKDEILSLVSSDETIDDKVNVYIGKENSVNIMNNSALVFRTIKRGSDVVGAIGVIGPCRMNYSKVISTIDRLARGIDDMLNSSGQDFGDDDNDYTKRNR